MAVAGAAVLLAAAIIVERTASLNNWQLLLLYLVPYLVAGYSTLKEAAEGLLHGEVFNEHFLMTIATLGALLIGFLPGAETQFPEAVFVMLFFQIGEMIEGYAEGRSRKSIEHLMEIRPDHATVLRGAEAIEVHADAVAVGETIVVKPGERIPLDGVITEGSTSLNTVALTGESVPHSVAVGDEVASGCINISGLIKMRVAKPFGESTASKIIKLVEEASEHKSKSETFIHRFAKVYTPIVVIAAVVLAVVPPLVLPLWPSQHWAGNPDLLLFSTWLYRALMFLVVSCPCALVISVPLSFFGGLGGASRQGILIKGANYIDMLAKVDSVAFDKTGTLTHGVFAVEAVHPDRFDADHLLHIAAHVEHFSTHPIAAALRDAFPDEATDGCRIGDVEEIAGQGIKAKVTLCSTGITHSVCVGNSTLMENAGAQWHDCGETGTVIHIAIDGEYAGHIVIGDKIKDASAEAIRALRREGVRHTAMLTGDRAAVAAEVAHKIGIDEYHAELMPADKLRWVEEHKASGGEGAERSGAGILAFVGDGINDAPVLARADVGIAMGALGSDAAIEAADVVLMDDNPTKVATAISTARRTLRIARQNVVFAIGVKLLVLLLAAVGLATMWMAVFADVGVTFLAVLNALRTMRIKKVN